MAISRIKQRVLLVSIITITISTVTAVLFWHTPFAVEVGMLNPYQTRRGFQLALSAQLLTWHNVVYIKIPSARCFHSTETQDLCMISLPR